jgi:hypothetical protein
MITISFLYVRRKIIKQKTSKSPLMRCLRDSALTRLKNLKHFSNLCDNFRFNAIGHSRYVVALVLCWRLAESDITVMPTNTCRDWLCWWYKHAAHVHSSSTVVKALRYKSEGPGIDSRCRRSFPGVDSASENEYQVNPGYQNEKRKSTSPSAIQVKNRRKTISIEKQNIISRLEKVNEWLTYAIMLDSLIVAYLQFVIMIELENVLSQKIKCLYSKTTTDLSESKVPKL